MTKRKLAILPKGKTFHSQSEACQKKKSRVGCSTLGHVYLYSRPQCKATGQVNAPSNSEARPIALTVNTHTQIHRSHYTSSECSEKSCCSGPQNLMHKKAPQHQCHSKTSCVRSVPSDKRPNSELRVTSYTALDRSNFSSYSQVQ